LFAYLTWTASPLFNLLLRLDPYGRLVLTREQIRASNLVGACLVCALVGLDIYLLRDSDAGLMAVVVFGLLPIAISGAFSRRRAGGRRFLGFYAAGLAGVGALGVALSALGVHFAGDLLAGNLF